MKPDCLILGAGEGTRMRPLTAKKPKVMLPVANKPLLEYILERSYEYIDDYYIVVGYKKDFIRNYFGDYYRDKKLNYIEQDQINGTAGAIGLAKDFIDKDFLALNGDNFIEESMIEKIIDHYSDDYSATMVLKEVDDLSSFGAVEVQSNRVESIREKPKDLGSGYANLGIYMFAPDIFSFIERTERSERGEYEITESLQMMLDERKVSYVDYIGYWSDVGRPWNLLELNELIVDGLKGLREEDEVEDGVSIEVPVQIGAGTKIKSGTYIEGPVKIGEDCEIGPNAYIRPYTSIGDNCHIGSSVEIKNSVIMDNSSVPHLSYVGDSVIGEDCNLGAGTNVANLRHDEKSVKMEVKGDLVDTGRRKLGFVMGDGAKTGINTTIYPGRKISSDSTVGPGSIVDKNI